MSKSSDSVQPTAFGFEGYIPDLIGHLMVKLNMHYHLEEVSDNYYGHLTKEGVWNGMIGQVSRKVI